MQEEIKFSYNWNNKLHCTYFTTIRLRNDRKYQKGKDYRITIKGEKIGEATIQDIRHFKINQINNYITGLDMGYDCKTGVEIIKKMYANASWETQEISLILLKMTQAQATKLTDTTQA